MGENQLFDTKGAAAYYGGLISPRTLEDLRLRGEGPAFYRLGSKIVYRQTDLDTWFASRRVNPQTESEQVG
jgi:hypothetical protein